MITHDEIRRWADSELVRLELPQLVRSGVITRVREGLGGSHTVVTYPPLDVLETISGEDVLEGVAAAKDVHLYAHVPFCEHMCPFCHYAKTYIPLGTENDLTRSYVTALTHEIEGWRRRLAGSTAASLYIGGGTPTSLSKGCLLDLLEALTMLPKASGFTACVETSPLTVAATDGRGKLVTMVSAGVNRISMGLQTFDDRLLRRSRGHTQAVALRAVETIADLGVEYNLDLIQDFPDQTTESLVADMQWIERFRPSQVTWYILRVHPGSPWYGLHRRGELMVPSAEESARRRLMIHEGMRRIGYTMNPGGRFVKDPGVRDRFKEVRSSSDCTLLGMGMSAYSHGWGWFFQNHSWTTSRSGIATYADAIRREGSAIARGFRMNQVEELAGRLVAGIRTGVRLPMASPDTESYLQFAKQRLDRLRDVNLVRTNCFEEWSLTERGTIFEEEICSLFYTEPVRQQLGTASRYWNSAQSVPLNSTV